MNTITLKLGRKEALRLVEYIDTLWRMESKRQKEEPLYYLQLTAMRCWLIKEVEGEDIALQEASVRGEWIDEKCPKCGSTLLGNRLGDKWCSFVECDYDNECEHKNRKTITGFSNYPYEHCTDCGKQLT